MTDLSDTPSKPSKLRKYALPLLAGVAVVAILGYVASRSGLDKALLRQQLDDFSARLHESALKNGRDVTFTYGEVGIEGSFSHKHAVVHDPKLTIKPAQGGTPEDTVVVGTEHLDIYAKAADLSAMEVQLPQPIDFTNPSSTDTKLLTISSDAPIIFSIAQVTEHDVSYLDFNHPVPQKLTFTYLREHQAEGVEDATPTVVPVYQKLAITSAAGSSIHTHLSMDGRELGSVTVDVHDVHLIPDAVPNGEVTIAEITANSSNMLNDKNENIAALKLHIGDITASADFLPYAPISLVIDGSYTGNATQTPEDVASIGAQQSAIKLTEFALTTKEAKLTANADFATSAGDALPEGTANVTLTNVPYVLKELTDNGIVNDTNMAIVAPVLEMTTGQKLAEIKDAAIDIKRQKGAAFTIGKATFEELFAAVLKGALSHHSQPIVVKPGAAMPDAQPDATKKLPAKGAMKVEEGARG